jgi:HPt (histidine-containing phosphotransfer) domain-containing protein
VDTKKGLSHYGDDLDIYIAVLRSYGVNTPHALEKLRNITDDNMQEGIILSHGIKGSSANICAEQVRHAAAELEAVARKGDNERFFTLRRVFLQDADYLVENINAWVNTYDDNQEQPTLAAPDRALLQKLKQACDDFNMSEIDDVMDELESVRYKTDGELIQWLREKIDISELAEAVERLEDYLHG